MRQAIGYRAVRSVINVPRERNISNVGAIKRISMLCRPTPDRRAILNALSREGEDGRNGACPDVA
jgi:hypothetical protein